MSDEASGEPSMATAGPTAGVNGTPSNGALVTPSREEEETRLTDHYGFQHTQGEADFH